MAEDSIRVEGLPGPLTEVRKIRGDDQVGSPEQLLNRAALVVRLTDACGNAIPSHPMTWHVNPGTARDLAQRLQGKQPKRRGFRNRATQQVWRPFRGLGGGRWRQATFNVTVDLDPSSMERLSGDGQSIGAGQFAASRLSSKWKAKTALA